MKFKSFFKHFIYLALISICLSQQKATAGFVYISGDYIQIKEDRAKSLFVYFNGKPVGPIKRHQLLNSLKRLNYWPFRGQKSYIDPVIIPLQILLMSKLMYPEIFEYLQTYHLIDLQTHYLIVLDILFSFLKYKLIRKSLAQTVNAENESYEMDQILSVCTGISPLLGVLVEFYLRRIKADMIMSSQRFAILGKSEHYLKSIEKYTHHQSWLETDPIIKYLYSKFKR